MQSKDQLKQLCKNARACFTTLIETEGVELTTNRDKLEGYFCDSKNNCTRGFYYRPGCALPSGFDDSKIKIYFDAVKQHLHQLYFGLTGNHVVDGAFCTLTFRMYEGTESSIGMKEHKDFGLLTAITSSTKKGLQIFDKDLKQWQDVELVEDELFVINGSAMNLVNKTKQYEAPIHRVVNQSCERTFLGFFLDPPLDYIVEYKGRKMTFIEYAKQKLKTNP